MGIAIGALLGGGLLATPTTITTTVVQTSTQTVATTVQTIVTQTVATTATQTVTQAVAVTQTVTATPRHSVADVALRRELGSLVGRHFLGVFQTVAVVTQPNTLCSALAASALASLPPYSRGYLVMYNDMPSYAISQATRDVLIALRSINYGGDVLLHAFVLRATNL